MGKNVLFGIVVYKESFPDTETFKSLLSSYKATGDSAGLHIYVYDNTPESFLTPFDFPYNSDVEIEYFHNPENPGISEAYNHIGMFASENRFRSIVFLDQDTHLPDNAYGVYTNNSESVAGLKVAIPKIMINDMLLSPSKYINFRSSALSKSPDGELSTQNLSWINSGMMVQTDFFISSGGYNPEIQLDFSDHFFVEKIKKQGVKNVWVLKLVLDQNLSAYTNTLQQDLTRYKSFLRDLSGYKKGKNLFKVFIYIDLPRLLRLSMKHKTLMFLKIRLQK